MEMSSATLAHTLAAAGDFGRQVVHGLLNLPSDGFNQLSDSSDCSSYRLDYKKPLAQEMRFSGFLAWEWLPCSAITPGIDPSVIEAYGRKILMDADPEKQSRCYYRPGSRFVLHVLLIRWEGIQHDLEMLMDRDREKTKALEGLKAGNSTESSPFPISDEECQQPEMIWAILQAEGSMFQDYLLHARSIIPAGQISGEDKEEIDGSIRCMRPVRNESHKPFSGSGSGAENGKFQIFIKTPPGKTILVWVSAHDTGESLKVKIAQKEGYSRFIFYILYEGTVLHENDRLGERKIDKNATLHVVYRLRGGSSGNRGTAGPSSYKDAARSKGTQSYKDASRTKGPQTEATLVDQPSPYIVEKLESTPVLEIKNEQVKGLFRSLQAKAVICRFNGFWPKSHDLHAWIYQNWTSNCQILLCSKGFFIVQFDSLDEYQKVLLQGPWFWGRAGLFITPWFPEFDANNMVVTKMPVWVRLPNLPLPYWHHLVLEDIGNLLGRFIKTDKDRQDKGLFTYARVCVEIDLSKGLPDRLHLKHESHTWLQRLDYENTAFRCRFCQLTGHLQDTCPLAKNFTKKKKGPRSKRKNWQADYAPFSDEEEGSEEEEQQDMQRNEETMMPEDAEVQSTGNQTPVDTKTTVENLTDASASKQEHKEDSSPGMGTQTALVIREKVPAGGIKRGHESEKSDSDKEHPSKQKPEMVNGRQVVIASSSQGRWVEVKNKRKGKKGKIDDYYQS